MENQKVEASILNVEDDGLQEEEKVEEFFALIRSFHEARNRRREELNNELEEMAKKNNKRKRTITTGNGQKSSTWVPSFEWQDFTEDIEFRRPPMVFPSPCNKKEDKKQQEKDDGLDLKLTL